MMYPLVREMAAPNAPLRVLVAVPCAGYWVSPSRVATSGAHSRLLLASRKRNTLIEVLHELHEDDPEGGYRVLADDLHDLGYQISERRVWRLCHVAGISSRIISGKRKYRKAGAPVHDDLVQRLFVADGPDQVWVTDITEHWSDEGKLYCCAIKNLWRNKIVGYSIQSRMKARIAVDALTMAVYHRGFPNNVIVHPDRSSQFRSKKYRKALKKFGLRGSIGRVGACGDNAAMESFFALLQKNVLDRQRWTTRQELRLAILAWTEGNYQRKRRQRRLDKLTPPRLRGNHNPHHYTGGINPRLNQTISRPRRGCPARRSVRRSAGWLWW